MSVRGLEWRSHTQRQQGAGLADHLARHLSRCCTGPPATVNHQLRRVLGKQHVTHAACTPGYATPVPPSPPPPIPPPSTPPPAAPAAPAAAASAASSSAVRDAAAAPAALKLLLKLKSGVMLRFTSVWPSLWYRPSSSSRLQPAPGKPPSTYACNASHWTTSWPRGAPCWCAAGCRAAPGLLLEKCGTAMRRNQGRLELRHKPVPARRQLSASSAPHRQHQVVVIAAMRRSNASAAAWSLKPE